MTCVTRGPIATARAKLEKSICPAFVTMTRFLDIPSYSLDKLCNYWSKIFEIFSKYAEKMHVSYVLCFTFLWNAIPKILTRRHYFPAHLCTMINVQSCRGSQQLSRHRLIQITNSFVIPIANSLLTVARATPGARASMTQQLSYLEQGTRRPAVVP